ncbi:MAG TPA: tetratricopeptide repeat-containing glycosyltransferase family protein [Tepidisphaeraceae bacterium]|nr:tetratricopeptide repeat-containing glycosyltransferase family protein [Tepidisphaeraceae bacterium]
MLGVALEHHRAGRPAEAEQIYREVLSGQPNHPDALHLLGVILGDKGQPQLAVEFIGRAIGLRADIADYHANLGEYLRRAGNFEQSAASFRHALRLKPDDAHYHNGLGVTLAESRQIEPAIAEFRSAIRLNSNYPDALSNLGGALRTAGRLDEALDAIRAAIKLQPQMRGAHNHLGLVLADMEQYQEAIGAYSTAIALKPDYAMAHCNLSQVYLLLGDYQRGWAEYEWRLGVPSLAGTQQFDRPRWHGGNPSGKTIFVHSEQGYGDVIHFARFIPQLVDRGANVVLGCPAELCRLFEGIVPTVIPGQPIPPHDFHCFLLSLGAILGIPAQSIPAPIPYLKSEPRLAQEWGRRFDSTDDRLRVGLVWGGSTTHTNDRNRSIKMAQFAPLASMTTAAFYSLQKGEPAAETIDPPPGMQLIDWTADLNDFADTAALIENLDLVIAVDTAAAHLAGAMGKKVWLMLPIVPDWRWMLKRDDSPWYPTVRLFRQRSRGDWSDVVLRVREELAKETRGASRGR